MKREALLAALDEELRFQMGGAPGAWIEPLTHIFTALEARGLAVVPVVATEGMLDRGVAVMVGVDLVSPKLAPHIMHNDLPDIWTAMLTASKDDPNA